MGKIKIIILTIISLALSLGFVYFEEQKTSYQGAQEVYRVYLDGKSLGIISSKEELEDFIDNEQNNLKDKFSVSKVYSPEGLEIKQELTYNEDVKTAQEIYDEIKDKDDFTIKGYTITITTEEDSEDSEENKKVEKVLYVLNKEDFINAVNSTVKAFINDEEYEAYLNNTQSKITDTGTLIENVYIKDTIMIKEDYIPASEEVFTNEKDLAKYILYGTMDDQQLYTVKADDTPTSIAEQFKLNIDEFLVANRDIPKADTLLYPGQQVAISLIKPIITVVKETHEVENQTVPYTTRTEDDDTLVIGDYRVVQEGVNGTSRVTKKVRRENGEIAVAYITDTETLTAPVEKVIKKGTKPTTYYTGPNIVATTENWAWPTKVPYVITEYWHAWRSYELHPGIDISGTGYGSPIYAANDGTVKTSSYGSGWGYYIEIDHGNGYVTLYAHCAALYVTPGQTVSRGQVIASMGSSGWSSGTHLHFKVEYYGQDINPFSLYQ